MNFLAEIIIILLGLIGLSVAAYIRHTKLYSEKLVCPIGFNCNAVVRSDYSRFLGIPVETLGMGYYALVAVGYFVALFQPLSATSVFILVMLSIGAFLFSIYLTVIQAFALRQWCSWCLVSAFLSTAIFIAIVFFSNYDFISLLAAHKGLIIITHALAAALGVGTATITDILFFRFLRDFRISGEEASVLASLSQTLWFALGLLVLTGVGVYLPQSEALFGSGKFLAKMAVIGVIILNGVFLNIIISPRLTHISFGDTHPHQSGELKKLRRLSFALGAISIVSWYSAFILGSLRNLDVGFWKIFGVYLAALVFAVLFSQYYEYVFARGQGRG